MYFQLQQAYIFRHEQKWNTYRLPRLTNDVTINTRNVCYVYSIVRVWTPLWYVIWDEEYKYKKKITIKLYISEIVCPWKYTLLQSFKKSIPDMFLCTAQSERKDSFSVGRSVNESHTTYTKTKHNYLHFHCCQSCIYFRKKYIKFLSFSAPFYTT